MKVDQLKKIIKECVKESFNEIFKEVLLEAVKGGNNNIISNPVNTQLSQKPVTTSTNSKKFDVKEWMKNNNDPIVTESTHQVPIPQPTMNIPENNPGGFEVSLDMISNFLK